MLVKINSLGVIELTPTNSTEAFALKTLENKEEINIRYKLKDHNSTENLETYKKEE